MLIPLILLLQRIGVKPMNKQNWMEHLSSWKQFLRSRLSDVEDIGEQIKINRQLLTLERVKCGAVLNPLLLAEFIEPSQDTVMLSDCNGFSLDLNESQKIAVRSALGDNMLTLIQGPPGTGKTQVIAETCLQLYQRNPGIRILVCSETHVAVNNLLSRISEMNREIRIIRIRDKENDSTVDEFSPETVINDYLKWVSLGIENKDAVSIIKDELNDPFDKSLEKALALSANIAGMTCNRAASYDFRNSTEMFDVAIIDEVCKATLPEILAPLLVSRKAVLLGDPKQLPPVFCSEELSIIHQLEDCNLDNYMYIDSLFTQSENTVLLDTQYRMSNQIGKMISEVFYDGQLKNGRNVDESEAITWINYTPSQVWPTIEEEEKQRPRIFNEDEIAIIKDLVYKIEKDEPSIDIGIITPYKAQAAALRNNIASSEKIKIDTVDGFQGKECDVIIYSVTRTSGSYRFLADKRRLNVALSRAKDKIFIIGYMDYAKGSKLLSDVASYGSIREV